MHFALDPVPHTAAAALIADKPAITRDVFDSLPDELKARAYTIAGIEDFDVLQSTRDLISRIPAGADWKATKKEIAAQISPWFTPAAAAARADLLLSHHAFTAYASCQAKIMDAQVDTFPFRQYLSTKDGKVRATHRALDGIILAADNPFWQRHTPPWEFRCRCQVVEILADEAEEERRKDLTRKPEDRRVLEGPALERLQNGMISRGPEQNHVLGTPLQSVRDTNLPYAEIATRWDPATRRDFEAWSDAMPLHGGSTLFQQLSSSSSKIKNPKSKISPPRPATFAEALAQSGLDKQDRWSRSEIANLRARLRVADPAQADDHISAITGARQAGAITEKEIKRAVQDLLDILPRAMADSLPKVKIHITDASLGRGVNGEYDSDKHTVKVTTRAVTGLTGEERRREMHRVLSHELMHWGHLSSTGPGADRYRAAIRSHYATRTAGDTLIASPGGGGYRQDKWWDLYAGREYAFEKGKPMGIELPTRYYQLWETPDVLATLVDPAQTPNAHSIRETFSIVHTFFDS